MSITTKMEGMNEEAAAAMEAMKNMSPEQKAMMEKMMGGTGMLMSYDGTGITTTVTQCMSNEAPVPQTEPENDCQTTHSINGNTVSFEVACADGISIGQVTYNGDSMQGEIKVQQTVEGQKSEATIEITGKYVGPCDE